jgi:hypothetical protein
MAQHQDLGVLPPRLAARQTQQRHSPGNNQEDQLQAHKPKIIARPAGPGFASHVPDTEPSHRRPAAHLHRWHRFSAPTEFDAGSDRQREHALDFQEVPAGPGINDLRQVRETGPRRAGRLLVVSHRQQSSRTGGRPGVGTRGTRLPQRAYMRV